MFDTVGARCSRVISLVSLLVILPCIFFAPARALSELVIPSDEASSLPQRMRLPVGSYWISGGSGGSPPDNHIGLVRGGEGNSYVMPAYCIDHRRSAPSSQTSLTAFSGNIRIRQFDKGRLVAEKPLADAISGSAPWISISGNDREDLKDQDEHGSWTDILVTPHDQNYDYAIVVDGLVLAGTDAEDVSAIYDRWKENKSLIATSDALDALRTTLLDPANADVLNDIEDARQGLEWQVFGDLPTGGVVPASEVEFDAVRAMIDGVIADYYVPDANSFLDIDDLSLTASSRGDWFSVVTGSSVPSAKAEAFTKAMSAIGLDVSIPAVHLEGRDGDLLMNISRVANLDRARAALANQYSSFKADANDSSSRINHILSGLYIARTVQKQAFAQALRDVAFERFGPAESSSGQIEYELLSDLKCASELSHEGSSRNEKLAIETLFPMRELAKELGVYADEFRRSRKIKVSSADQEVCFQWIELDGKVTTKKFARRELGKEALVSFGPALFITEGDDSDTDDLLRSFGAELVTMREIRLREATNSVRSPTQKPGSKPDYVVTRWSGSDEKNVPTMDIALLELSSNGDAGIVKIADGSLILVDTGVDEKTVGRLTEFVERNYGGKAKPSIRLVITHSHKDHIGGLSAILTAGYRVDEILIGLSVQDANGSSSLTDISARLKEGGYVETSTPSASHFVRNGVVPWIDLLKPAYAFGSVESFILQPAKDTTIALHHIVNGKTPNDAGFVVRLRHRANSWLLTDDLSDSAMQKFLLDLPTSQLSAGYMKWPHHLWFPADNTKPRKVLDQFLNRVGAHTYAFSNKGHYTHTKERYAAISNYLRAKFDDAMQKTVNTFWTDEMLANLVFR